MHLELRYQQLKAIVCVCVFVLKGAGILLHFRGRDDLPPSPSARTRALRRGQAHRHLPPELGIPCGSQAPYASWIGFCSWDPGLLHTGVQISLTELSPSATLRISKGMNKWWPDLRLLKQQESNLTPSGVLSELFGGLNLNLADPSTPTLWHSIICIYITGFTDTFCSA